MSDGGFLGRPLPIFPNNKYPDLGAFWEGGIIHIFVRESELKTV